MEFVKLLYNSSSYSYKGSTSIKMDIVGLFLESDVGCYWPTFKAWALDDSQASMNSNITVLEKENGNILLSDLYSEESMPTEVHMTIKQFIQLLDDWENKVCKLRPKEVIIKHENGEFIIETSNK